MATTAAQLAADDAAVEAIRRQFGDAEAAKLAADLYKLRRTPEPTTFAGFPRWAVIAIALWLAVLETADKLPQVLLAYPRYEAALADVQTKLMQPDLTAAQLAKARLDAKAAAYQPALLAAQAYAAANDASAKGMRADDTSSANRLNLLFDLLNPDHPDLAARGVIDPTKDPALRQILIEQAIKQAAAGAAKKADDPPPQAPPAATPPAAPDVPPTPTPAPSAVTPAPVQAAPPPQPDALAPGQPPKSQAYQDGARDRNDLEAWFASLSGDEHDGAEYWASVRSVKGEHKCTDGKGATSKDFQKGCEEAWQKLIPIDARRKAEPDYKDGFNNR